MAKQAILDLQDLVRDQPQFASSVFELLPELRGFLDGIADAGDAYQYPQLYSELAKLALLADDAPVAEELLRQGLALDTHQPLAKVWLALAVLIQGGSADDEVQSVIDELNDPLWDETAGVEAFGRDDLLLLAQVEVEEFRRARLELANAAATLVDAIQNATP